MKKIHRFICFFAVVDNQIENISENVVRQIQRVLKLEPGEHVMFLSGEGDGVEVELVAVEPEVRGTVVRTFDREGEVDRACTMYVAVLKRDLFELVVQKVTELGVTEIVPIITDRTIKLGLKQERLEAIAKEAVELSGRSVVPIIHEPISFSQAIKQRRTDQLQVFFQKGAPIFSYQQKMSAVAGWIGPEGGWSEKEESLMSTEGFISASLTSTTLRGETAAIVGAYTLITG